jgi:hypothetical protein
MAWCLRFWTLLVNQNARPATMLVKSKRKTSKKNLEGTTWFID